MQTQVRCQNISNKRKLEVVNLIDNGHYSEAVTILLTDYYDPLYLHSLNKINFDHEINNDNLNNAKKKLIKFLEK